MGEVVSDSPEDYDRGRKFGLYRACPTVQEYVLVATKYQAVEVFRRTPNGWAIYQAYGPGEEVELTSIGVRIPLAAFYRRTDVPENTDEPGGEVGPSSINRKTPTRKLLLIPCAHEASGLLLALSMRLHSTGFSPNQSTDPI